MMSDSERVCRCGHPGCDWSDEDDRQRDLMEAAEGALADTGGDIAKAAAVLRRSRMDH